MTTPEGFGPRRASEDDGRRHPAGCGPAAGRSLSRLEARLHVTLSLEVFACTPFMSGPRICCRPYCSRSRASYKHLALEVLWSSVTSKAHLWDFTHAAVISWLQVMVVFQSIVLVWLFYAHLVLRFRWVPEIRDSVVPFLFGLGEFTLAEMLSPEHLHVWFYVLAAIFGFAQWATMTTFAAARKDRENDWFFSRFPESVWIRYGPPVVTVGSFLSLGALIHVIGASGILALVSVVIANLIVVGQLFLQRFYWNRSLALASSDGSAGSPRASAANP